MPACRQVRLFRAWPMRESTLLQNPVSIASCASTTRYTGAAGLSGRAQRPRAVRKPLAITATGPNQARSWDITYLPVAVRGQFLRLYIILEIYSRKICGWEVHHEELASHAATLIEKASLRHNISLVRSSCMLTTAAQ